jgi:hypothetical protein
MDQSFDEWMEKQFPDDEPDEKPELAAEVCELCERYGLPTEATLVLLKELIRFSRAIIKVDNFVKRCETQGLARQGFRKELMMLIAHGFQRDVNAT